VPKDSDPSSSSSSNSRPLTDWVIENLEDSDSSITSSSSVQAGENDTLPATGLEIANLRILAASAAYDNDNSSAPSPTSRENNNNDDDKYPPIRLLVGRNGWGTGVHPTTRLCLEWLRSVIQGGEVLLDYGTGSGILSVAALHYGAARCVGVDVEAEALMTATRNLALNGYGDSDGRFEAWHTREIQPYGLVPPADLVVANILVGQLVRPSMVAALVSNVADGGLICFSGVRPAEVLSLQNAYGDALEWVGTATLAAVDTTASLESYGFDVGEWSRLVGRKKSSDRDDEITAMSELAVS
jgi:ribosomal protein L11 methyltransferase